MPSLTRFTVTRALISLVVCASSMLSGSAAMAIDGYVGSATSTIVPETYSGNLSSCAPSTRAISSLDCTANPLVGYAEGWVIGTGSNLGCWTGGAPNPVPVPSCTALNQNKVYSCNVNSQTLNDHCMCPPGWQMCGSPSKCQKGYSGSCPAGQSFDPCTNTCSGNLIVYLQTTPVAQGATTAANAGIAVNGNLKLDGAGASQGDIFMASGKSVQVNGGAATSLNLGNFTTPGAFTLSAIGDLWIDDADGSGRGVQLEAADRPLVTRSNDPFTSGAYSGIGRWGLFKELNSLAIGIPNLANQTFKIRSYDLNSVGIDRVTVNGSTGEVSIGGPLTVNGPITSTTGGFTLPTGAGLGKVLTSDATGNASWQTPAAGVEGTGTVNALALFTAASTLGSASITESATAISMDTDVLVVDKANDRVGVGDASPDAKLDVVFANANATAGTEVGMQLDFTDTGAVSAGTDTSKGMDINFTRSGATGGTIRSTALDVNATDDAGGTSTLTGMRLAVSGADTNYAIITTGGNVGIGDTTPNSTLSVVAAPPVAAGVADMAFFGNAGGIGGGARLLLSGTGAETRAVAISGIVDGASGNGHAMVLETNTSGANPVERMRISAAGRVGIGQSVPAALLDVGSGSGTANAIIGNTLLGANATYGLLQHKDSPNYAVIQDAAGRTIANSAAGQPLNLRVADKDLFTVQSNGANGWASFNGGMPDDTQYDFVEFKSGAARHGVIIWDGNWDGCASSNEFCIKAENNNWLNLKSDAGIAMLSAVTLSTGAIATDMLNLTGMNSNNDGIAFANRTALSNGGAGDWLRLNNNSEFTSGTYTPGLFWAEGGLYVGDDEGFFWQSEDIIRTNSTGWFANRILVWGIGGQGAYLGCPFATNTYAGLSGAYISAATTCIGANGSGNTLAVVNANGGAMSVYAASLSEYSSARFKKNITTLDGALEKLVRLRGVTFDWKDGRDPVGGGLHDVGFIAEEVKKVFPELVTVNDLGQAETVSYTRFAPIIVEAVKEQQEIIERLEARIEALEARLK